MACFILINVTKLGGIMHNVDILLIIIIPSTLLRDIYISQCLITLYSKVQRENLEFLKAVLIMSSDL